MKKKFLTGLIAAAALLTLTGCQSHKTATVKKTSGVGKKNKQY